LSLPLSLGGVPKDDAVRAHYQALLEAEGAQALHSALMQVDALTAKRLHPNDTRRVIRALEVYMATGRPISVQVMPSYKDSPYDMLLYAREWPRETLYSRIDRRVDQMMRLGLQEEVQGLQSRGLSPMAQSMQGLGYKEMLSCLQGEVDLPQAVELIKRRTRNYAKRQLTWFRADPRVRWINEQMDEDSFVDMVGQDMRKHEN
jgi:tRNA dimethylallyltransferase